MRRPAISTAANGLVWLAPAPADNTLGIAVRGDVAAREKLATLEDFARWTKDGKVKLAPRPNSWKARRRCPPSSRLMAFKLSGDQLLVLSGGDTAATIKAAAEGTSGASMPPWSMARTAPSPRSISR